MSAPIDVDQPTGAPRGWRVLAPLRFREFRLLIAAVSILIFSEGMRTVYNETPIGTEQASHGCAG